MKNGNLWPRYIMAIALIGILALASVPSAWAAPLAQPVRQTVPSPTVPATAAPATAVPTTAAPAATPEPGVIAPSLEIRLPIQNEGTATMSGYLVALEQVAGVEYLIEDVVQEPPFEYPLADLAPGQEFIFEFVARISADAMPCTSYPFKVTLVKGTESTLLQEYTVTAPCDLLPDTGV